MGNFLKRSRHGTTFYFRRRVPDDLRQTVGKPYLTKSLETGERREAMMRARLLAAKTDILFSDLRAMPPKDRVPADFGLKLDLNELGKPTAITVTDATPSMPAHWLLNKSAFLRSTTLQGLETYWRAVFESVVSPFQR